MLSPLVALSLLSASTALATSSHDLKPRHAKRNSTFVAHHEVANLTAGVSFSVVDDDLLAMDLRRVNGKYKHSRNTYAANLAKFSGHSKRHEGVKATAREMERRNAELAREGKRANGLVKRAGATSEVPLTDFYSSGQDVLYFGEITIGTGKQSFNIDFDTGSADLWVPSQKSATKHTKFSNSGSATLETSTAEWDIQYGTGQSKGYLARDTVSVGSMTYPKQIFALADSSAPSLEALPVDGFMGMGFSTIATSGAPTFFENLITAGSVAQPYFGFYINHGSSLSSKSGNIPNAGELCLGCIDDSKYTGSISYNKVTSQGYWEVAMDGVSVDGKIVAGTSCNAALDTGTTLIYLPVATATALYKSLGGKPHGSGGSYSVPCAATFQTIGLVFNGVTYNIPLADVFLGYASSGSTSQCLLGIIGNDQLDPDGNEVAIVGDLFLKAVYSVYSYSTNGSPAVGLAQSTTAMLSSSGGSSSSSASSSDNSSGSGSGSGSGSTATRDASDTGFVASGTIAPSITSLVPPAVQSIVTKEPKGDTSASASAAQPVFTLVDSAAAASAASAAALSSSSGSPADGFEFTVFSVATVAPAEQSAAAAATTQAGGASSGRASVFGAGLASLLVAVATATVALW